MRFLALLSTVILTAFLTSCNKDESDSSKAYTATSVTIQTTTVATTTTAITTTTPPQTTVAPPPPTPVAKGQRDAEYEKRMVFIGDSICSGLKVYPKLLNPNQTFAEKNVAVYSINNYNFTYNNASYKIVNLIGTVKPEIIYIWMGINDIRVTSKEAYAKNLDTLAINLLAVSPQSKIKILSISPTTAAHPWKANQQIKDYNKFVADYFKNANRSNVSYLDINTPLCDATGFLQPAYNGGDGLHLSAKAYAFLLAYISDNR